MDRTMEPVNLIALASIDDNLDVELASAYKLAHAAYWKFLAMTGEICSFEAAEFRSSDLATRSFETSLNKAQKKILWLNSRIRSQVGETFLTKRYSAEDYLELVEDFLNLCEHDGFILRNIEYAA